MSNILRVAIENKTIEDTNPNDWIFDLDYNSCTLIERLDQAATGTSLTLTPTVATEPCVFWVWRNSGHVTGAYQLWSHAYWSSATNQITVTSIASSDKIRVRAINHKLDNSGIIEVPPTTQRQINLNDNLTSEYEALHVTKYIQMEFEELGIVYKEQSYNHGLNYTPAFFAIVEGLFINVEQQSYTTGIANLNLGDGIDGTSTLYADVCVDRSSIHYRAASSDAYTEILPGQYVGWASATAHIWLFDYLESS
jgi:hypothetical protein